MLLTLVGGGGFEPPKSLTTDLQSAKHSTFHASIFAYRSNIQEYHNKTQINKKSCPVHVQIPYHVQNAPKVINDICLFYPFSGYLIRNSVLLNVKENWRMIKILLSKKLGELRWTQKDLARATGIRYNTINDLYHDMAARVSLEHLDLICEALDCDLSEIVEYTPNTIKTTKTRTGHERPE